MRAFAHCKVLVLNKHMTAVGVVTLPRAIVMLFSSDAKGAPKAHVVDHSDRIVGENGHVYYGNITPYTWEEWATIRPKDNEAAIHACRGTFRIPEVIKLSRYDKLPIQKIHFSRRSVYKRDNLTCQYCHKKFASEELTIDHIHPSSLGGKSVWENCCLACTACNKAKADRVPNKKYVVEKDENGKSHTVAYYTCFFRSGKKFWEVTIREPKKPKYNFFKSDIHYDSWKQWIDVAYWNVELNNENKD